MVVRHLRDATGEDPVDLFVLVESGSLIQFNVAEVHHHIRGVMIVREKDENERTVTGIMLTNENVQLVLSGQRPRCMTIDGTDVEKILPKYYSKHSV